MSAASVAATGIESIGKLIATLNDLKDREINSLTKFNNKYLISSRVYIEDTIAEDPVIPALVKMANQMFASQVLVALSLDNLVVGGKTAKQMISAVSTEQFETIVDLAEDLFGKDNVQIASVEESKQSEELKEKIRQLNVAAKGDADKVDASHLFTGRMMELKIGDKSNPATLYFFVQLFPYILPKVVVEAFIGNNTIPSKELRKAQLHAGEISFFKDYLFCRDLVNKRRKALKADKNGILREIEDFRMQSAKKSMANFKPGAIVNRNAASTITIVRKSTIEKLCTELGINLSNYEHRQRIFDNTFGLMMYVYDPDYDIIDLYMNGVQARGEYKSAMVQSAAKKDDLMDIKQLLTIMAAGNAPKF